MRLRNLVTLIVFAIAAIIGHAQATVTLTASHLSTGMRVLPITGQLCMVPTNNNGAPLGFAFGGTGQGTQNQVCAPVVSGSLTATLVPDTAQTNPQNICLFTTLTSVTAGNKVVRTWPCLQPASTGQTTWCTTTSGATACDLDNYPLETVVLPVAGSTSSGSGSSSGVQYNPTTTAYIFASFSGLYDDGDGNSTALPVSSYTCASGTCTVNFASASGLAVGGAVDMNAVTGWPNANQIPQSGSFQVVSTPTTTQITFASSVTGTCSSSCGSAYDASYWGIWTSARQPYLYGHGAVYGAETDLASLASSFSSKVNCSAGTPAYLIIEGGQNDLFSGASASSIESSLTSIWSQAHTAGCIVVQGTIVPANYGTSSGSQSIWQGALQVNRWMYQQAKSASNASSGQYWDRFYDPASTLADMQMGNMPAPKSNAIFAARLNEAFSAQGTSIANLPPLETARQGGVLDTGGIAHFTPYYDVFWDKNYNAWMNWSGADGGIQLYTSGYQGLLTLYNSTFSAGQPYPWCPSGIGVDSNANNIFADCFGYAASGSTSNYRAIVVHRSGGSSDVIVAKFFAGGGIQFPNIVASSGLAALCVDTSGNVQVGSCGASAIPVDGSSVTAISSTTPAAPAGSVNCTWQRSGTTASCYVPTASASTSSVPVCADTSGSGSAQSCNTSPTFTPSAGSVIVYTSTTANTGTALTLNVNSSTASPVAKWQGSATLAAGDVAANKPVLAIFDGTNWLLSTIGNAPSGGSGSGSGGSYPTPVTVSGTAVTELDVTSCITSSYKVYDFIFSATTVSGSASMFGVQYSTDGGATWDSTSSNYNRSRSYVDTTSSNNGISGGMISTLFPITPAYNSETTSAGLTSQGTIRLYYPLAGRGSVSATVSMMSGSGFNQAAWYYTASGATVNALRVYWGGGTITGTVTCQPLPQ